MSQGEKKKDQKKNTDAWKLKQQEKKKKKQTESTQPQPNKEVPETQIKKPQSKKQKAKTKKQQVKEVEQTIPVVQTQVPSPQAAIRYKNLSKVDNKISQKQRSATRSYQWQLVLKYSEQYISKQDIILFIGQKQWLPSCQQVYISEFNNCINAQLVCRYSDITYFLEGSVTKIFIEAQYIFANGSILAKKGSLNLVLLAQYYRIPVVGFGGSWSYNGWTPLSQSALNDRYGEPALDNFDWIEAKYFKSLILQVGSINAKQISTFPPIIYKDLNLSLIQW